MGRLKAIREAIAACFQANKEPLTKGQVLAWIGNNYREADFNLNTIQTQLYRSCVNSKAKTSAPKILWYNKSNKTYRLLRPTDPVELPQPAISEIESDGEIESQSDSTFALEAHLRDYLARNLSILEKGLKLWRDSPSSVEFAIDNRRIDLLAEDAAGVPVVIELKLGKSYDRVIGQALLYQGLISQKLGVERVRIMLVAGEVSKELKIACGRQKDVSLFEYAITMAIKNVSFAIEEGV